MPAWGTRGEWPVAFFSGTDYASGTDTVFVTTDAFPAPDTEAYTPTVRSNLQVFTSITGERVGVFPEVKSAASEINMTWTLLSGSWLKERIQQYIESGTGLRITPHTGPTFSGVFVDLVPRARTGRSDGASYARRQTAWDLQAKFLPINVESGT